VSEVRQQECRAGSGGVFRGNFEEELVTAH
jgi:hypothetical protein